MEETDHGTFIEGRVGAVFIDNREIGLVGEINPKVLEVWGLENPTIGFEVDLSKLFDFNQITGTKLSEV